MLVSIIIVHYQCLPDLEQCLQSIQQHVPLYNKEVLVVDNASIEPEKWTSFASKFSFASFFQLPENIGFGRANQFAIDRAKGQYLFLLNPDTVLESDVSVPFLAFMENPLNAVVGCCGGELYATSGRPVTSYGNFPSLFQSFASLGFYLFFKSFYYRKLSLGSANTYTQPTRVDYIAGADWFVRKEVLVFVGGFDPDFFLYFEETELAWRLQKAGYQSWILPHVRIRHEEGGASGHNQERFNAFAYRHYLRSERMFYQKTKGPLYGFFAIPLHLISMTLHLLAKGKLGEWIARLKVWFS